MELHFDIAKSTSLNQNIVHGPLLEEDSPSLSLGHIHCYHVRRTNSIITFSLTMWWQVCHHIVRHRVLRLKL